MLCTFSAAYVSSPQIGCVISMADALQKMVFKEHKKESLERLTSVDGSAASSKLSSNDGRESTFVYDSSDDPD